jgi:lysophospholipase L1-like esterase
VNRSFLHVACLAAFVAGSLAGSVALAQSPSGASSGISTDPASAAKAAEHAAWQKARDAQLKNDWPWLGYYKEADLKLGQPVAGENRVVFMGDSITALWNIEGAKGMFAGKPYFDRGISGQTTPQMVLRFRQDVIDLKPKVVVILGGTNDIAGNTGPMTLKQTEGNLASMAELAGANGIRVVLCSVLPVFDFPWSPGLAPAGKVLVLNAWIKEYAAKKGFVYVDFHSAMKDGRGGLPSTLSLDGVHPTAAGYAVMAPLVEAGIEQALKQATKAGN